MSPKKKASIPPLPIVRTSKPPVSAAPKARQKYVALNVIDYVSCVDGYDKHVEHGDVFDDMNKVGVRNELDHGNIKEYAEEGEGQ